MEDQPKLEGATLWAISAVLDFLVLFLQWVFGKGRRTRKGLPPGSMGWPLLGETLQLIATYITSNPEPFVDTRMSRKLFQAFSTIASVEGINYIKTWKLVSLS